MAKIPEEAIDVNDRNNQLNCFEFGIDQRIMDREKKACDLEKKGAETISIPAESYELNKMKTSEENGKQI